MFYLQIIIISHVHRLGSYSDTKFLFFLPLQISCSSGNNYASQRFTGTQIPGVLKIWSCNQVNVFFHSDNVVTRTGFNLTYTITAGKLLFRSTSASRKSQLQTLSRRYSGAQISGVFTISSCNRVNVYFQIDVSVTYTGFILIQAYS